MLGTSVSRYIIVNTLPLNSEKDGRRGGAFSDNLSIRLPISIPFFAGVSALPLGSGVLCCDAPRDSETVLVGESGRPAALRVGTREQLHSPSTP